MQLIVDKIWSIEKCYNIYNKQEVGGIEYVYDEGAIYGKILKILCKSTILIPTQIFFPKKLIKGGYISNYTCEPIDNFFIIASKKDKIQ